MVEAFRVRHYRRRTEEAYVAWVRRFIVFHEHRHPRELAEADLNRFLTYLAVEEHVAASTQNQALSAVLFLYQHVLQQPLNRIDGVVRANRPKRLPVVLTVDEVSRVMAHLSGDKWLVASLLYGGGLRLLESLRLAEGNRPKPSITPFEACNQHNASVRLTLHLIRRGVIGCTSAVYR